jgi:hypothetical protein
VANTNSSVVITALAAMLVGAVTAFAQPTVTMSADRLAFRKQPIYTDSAARTVTISNVGDAALRFSSIRAFGNFLQRNTCGLVVGPKSSCTITIVFQPEALGRLNGRIRLIDNASDSPQQIKLRGKGIPHAITTYHYDNARTGANTTETLLKPANVNKKRFGKLFSLPVDGGIVAQPLYVPDLKIPDRGRHNVIYVATEHNSLYAFDADDGSPLWITDPINFGAYLPNNGCPGLDTGIIGTPVIDQSTKTIYLEVATLRDGIAVDELHALDITTGVERPFSPVDITASVPGTGYGSRKGILSFDPNVERPRPALLLDNGLVYVRFASNCDFHFFPQGRGWLFAYDAFDLLQKSVFVTSPNGYGGGIWEAGDGPAADAYHNIYISTGNGDFDVARGGSDYGDSVIKLASGSLQPLDYFTPHNQKRLGRRDRDLGSGGITLLPDQAIPPKHLMVTGGEPHVTYLLNQKNLGGYNPSVDNVVQKTPVTNSLYSTPTYWNNTLYFAAAGDSPKAFSFSNGRMSDNPTSQAGEGYNYPGSVMVVSADRQSRGILWAVQHGGTSSGNEVLHAYDATNLARELYNSDQAGDRDLPGIVGNHFESIIVANGKVYVPTGQPQLSVFGLLR